MASLEKDFEKAVKQAHKKIDKYLAEAEAAIEKAEEIAEEYGIPFSTSVSPLGQCYKPTTFDEKWGALFSTLDENGEETTGEGQLNSDDLMDIIGFYVPEYDGWEHSMVC